MSDSVEMSVAGYAPNAFDDVASTYDATFTRTALGATLREIVWQRLEVALAASRRVLELGCGTGEDAVRLARLGLDVVATDSAPSMLRVAAEKVRSAGCAARVELRCVPIERAGELDGPFDGVFSNFGAVNCVPDLRRAARDLAKVVVPGAPLVFVAMGRDVPWEWAWFLTRGRWQQAFRRRRAGGTAWRGMQIAYPTPRQLEAALEPWFETVACRPLGIVLPPSYAGRWLERSPRALAALARIERALHERRSLAAVADHYVLEARRTRVMPQ